MKKCTDRTLTADDLQEDIYCLRDCLMSEIKQINSKTDMSTSTHGLFSLTQLAEQLFRNNILMIRMIQH